jgi:hypothetical protein
MTRIVLSRRHMLETGALAMTAAVSLPRKASALSGMDLGARNEQIIRKYYAAREQKDWSPFDARLADNFTFTSGNNDDHISKSAFKTRCWETQVGLIKRFDLEQQLFGSGNEAFVKYLCHTKNDRSFRNVEYLRGIDEKLEAIECYFGAQSSFASAVGSGQN